MKKVSDFSFRELTAEEIECRVSMIKVSINDKGETKKGLQLLLYKTARTDMDILDETLGVMGWDCQYTVVKDNLYCTIGLYDEANKQWVYKSDCGVESKQGDKEKGEASDSFKRAGTKCGIGRELYTSPFIWITDKVCDIKEIKDRAGKTIGACRDNFNVTSISYDKGRINGLTIYNTTKKCEAFSMFTPKKTTSKSLQKDLEETNAKHNEMGGV